MHTILVGANHESAPLEIRERFAYAGRTLPEMLHRLRADQPQLQETVLLTTCNRIEVYAVTGEPERASAQLRSSLLETSDQARFLYLRTDREAVEHLCAVAAGIDSLVLGETQILGQVKTALQAALKARTAGPILSALFRCALRAGKRARNETAISRYPVSASSVAVELAAHCLGDLQQRTALILGSGKMSELAGQLLRKKGVRRLLVANRTDEHAQDLAQHLGGRSIPFGRLSQALASADLVISSTAAPQIIIRAAQVAKIMKRRTGHPLLLIDLAVPRDIDPQVRTIEGVSLYNIDDLRSVGEDHLRERQDELPRVAAIIHDEVEAFMGWLAARQAVPLLKALRSRAEHIRQAELAQALPRLTNLTPQERRVIEALSQRIVNRFLHEPTMRLKERVGLKGLAYHEALCELFGLDGAEVNGTR